MTILSRRGQSLLVLTLFWFSIFAVSLKTPALLDDADSVHAEAAREMVVRGDWTTLYVNGIRYLEKAPFMYWLAAAGIRVFGPAEWVVRLPVAVFELFLVLVIYELGSFLWDRTRGFCAGLVYVTSLGPYTFTRVFLPDVILTFFVTLCLFYYLQILRRPEPTRRILGRLDPRSLGLFASAALAVLTKGLVGCVLVGGIIVFHMLLGGRWDLLRRLQLLPGTVLFALLAAPWHLAAGFANKGFFWFYFINEHFLRYLGLRYPKDYDKVPLGLFWLLHLAWLFPWSGLLWSFARRFPKRLRALSPTAEVNLFLFTWIGFVLVFFSFSTSQEYYTFPALPAFALLLGDVLGGLVSGDAPAAEARQARVGLGVVALVGVSTGAALLWLVHVGEGASTTGELSQTLTRNPDRYALFFGHFHDLTPATFARLSALAKAVASILFVGSIGSFLAAMRGKWRFSGLSLALMMVGLLHYYHAGMVAFEPVLSSKGLARVVDQHYRAGDEIVVAGKYEGLSSLNYYTRKPVHVLEGHSGNLWYGSHYPDAPPIFYDDDSAFLSVWESDRRVFLLAQEEFLEQFLGRNPAFPYRVLAEEGGKKLLVNW